jgi:putative sterol carrier protein
VNAKEFFETLEARVDPARLDGIKQSYLFDVDGEGQWLVDVRDDRLTVTEGAQPADVTIKTSGETFAKIAEGRQNPTTAYMTGKLRIEGDLGAAMKLQKFF